MAEDRLFAHEQDIAWIVALWKAIHWGDPSPERNVVEIDETGGLIAAALVSHLAASEHVGLLAPNELHERLAAFGIRFVGDDADAPVEADKAGSHTVCTKVPGGRLYCFKVHSVSGPPPGEPGR
jgi:hypothetical protein